VRPSIGDSKQQRGQGARLTEMANVSELLINLVSIAMPKLLIGINQNGVRSDNSLEYRVTSSVDRRGRGRA